MVERGSRRAFHLGTEAFSIAFRFRFSFNQLCWLEVSCRAKFTVELSDLKSSAGASLHLPLTSVGPRLLPRLKRYIMIAVGRSKAGASPLALDYFSTRYPG